MSIEEKAVGAMFIDPLESIRQDPTKAILSAGGQEHELVSRTLGNETLEELKVARFA